MQFTQGHKRNRISLSSCPFFNPASHELLLIGLPWGKSHAGSLGGCWVSLRELANRKLVAFMLSPAIAQAVLPPSLVEGSEGF